jgi:hypothetical protein
MRRSGKSVRAVRGSAYLFRSRRGWHLAVALMVVMGIGSVAQAEMICVEEDWKLIVKDADPDNSAPQLTCVIAPLGGTNSLHIQLELNHQTQPFFAPGGLQLQVWNGKQAIVTRNSPFAGVLSLANETIRWTTKVSLQDNGMLFEVVNGSSTSWGAFGGQGYLKTAVSSATHSLAEYSPETSRAKSGIGFAANRVQSLVLQEVRYYSSEGLILRDTTRRVVFALTQ